MPDVASMTAAGRRARAFFVTFAVAGAAISQAAADDLGPHPGGFWKCRVSSGVHAEFDGEDPVGLAGHSHIKTDCALHWSDKASGKTYCFASNPSFLEFDDNPDILPKARAFWAAQPQR